MRADQLEGRVASAMGSLAIAAFLLLAGGSLFFDVALGPGRLLALVGTGVGAVGGVALLASDRASGSAVSASPLFVGVQLTVFTGPVVWNLAVIDHAGFRGMALVGGGGVLCIGCLLVLAAVLGPDRVPWLDDRSPDAN